MRHAAIRIAAAAVACVPCLTIAVSQAAGGPTTERIVGGDVADPGDWPFAAALTSPQGDQFCGGAVIAPSAVLTAAHCVVGARPNRVRVVTGRADLTDAASGQELEVDKIFVHPRYVLKGRRDVAVLRLTAPTSALPVALATGPEDGAATVLGAELRVAGWGATKPGGGAPSEVLRDVSTFVVKARRCDRAFIGFRASEEICTVGEPLGENNTSSCYGDSGGPLVADTIGGARLVGAVSYGGVRCGIKDPTVYARVAANFWFITKKAGLR